MEEREGGEMSKKDYITGRMDGLKLALRIADRDGIDGIRKEIAYRNNGGINTRLSMRELDEASQTIKENCVDTILIMSMYALRDEYGYGKDRMQRFYDRFMLKTDMVLNHVSYEMVRDIKKCRKAINETGNGANCNSCSWGDIDLDGMALCGEDTMKAIETKLEG